MRTFIDHLSHLSGGPPMPIVRKIGGSTAVHVSENLRRFHRDRANGLLTPIVLSAVRDATFNFTEQLMYLCERIEETRFDVAHGIINSIGSDLRRILHHDSVTRTLRASARLPHSVQRTLRSSVDRANEAVDPVCSAHHRIQRDGIDRIVAYHGFPGHSRSIIALGEIATAEIYRLRSLAHDQARIVAFPVTEHEHVLRTARSDRQSAADARALMCDFLRAAFRASALPLIPGYLPGNARTRNYSDLTAIDAAIATRMATDRTVLCSVEKEFPILGAAPGGGSDSESVDDLSYVQAECACRPDGFAPGVVHPEAIVRAREHDIPIIVHNPALPERGATLIYD